MYYNLLHLGVKRNILNNISYKKYLFQNSKSQLRYFIAYDVIPNTNFNKLD
jgi:hypothetical protein